MNARNDEAAEQKRHDDGTDDGTAPQLAVRIEHNRRCRVVLMRRLVLLLEEFALSCVSHAFIMHFVGMLHRPSPSICFFFAHLKSVQKTLAASMRAVAVARLPAALR